MPSKNKKPTISLCIPTFNRADLLDQTLQSVAAQTVKPYEVIITDNHSTDDTKKVGEYYQKKYGFKFIVNRKNLGMIGNWNKAIQQATGEYICLLHSDDLITPDWHETWIKTIQNHSADFYTGAIAIINDKNKPLFTCHIFPTDKPLSQPNAMNELLRRYTPMLAPSGASIYRKKIFDEIGLYDPTHKTEADVPHFLSLASRYKMYYRDHIVFCWRTHANQTFDKEKAKKTSTAELARLENYFSLVQAYNKKSGTRNKNLLRIHAFMSIASINLYLAKLKIAKVVGAWRLMKQYFPTLLTEPYDWYVFLKIQLLLLRRTLTLQHLNKQDARQLEWLTSIKT